MKKVWCFAPQTGGVKISPDKSKAITAQVEAYEKKQEWYPHFKLKIRFKGQFCYLDALKEGGEPFPIGRLRYFDQGGWSLAFYTYSSETYKPCVFSDGKWIGKLEDAIDICALYLQD
jgi:hypothetical protein